MLTRAAATATGVCILLWALPGVARAEPKPAPVVVSGDNNGGWVDTAVTSPASGGDTAQSVGSTRSNAADDGITCAWTEEPAFAQTVWATLGVGEAGGRWYDVRCSDGGVYLGLYVPPASGNVPPAVVLAGSLARTAVNRLQLPSPQVGHSPAGQALVGLPTWFWVDSALWQPLRQRTSAGPVWAEVTATPVSTSWDPGDGSSPFTCGGPGRAYDRSRSESEQSTDCSYTYGRSSADQPQTGSDDNDRFFTVTVTTTWQVSWSGPAGSGGTLPVLTRSSSFPLPVAQRQTVVTGGSG